MNFLICGLGSIGQRHARLLRRVLGDEANLYAYRSRGLDIVIRDDMTATPGARPEVGRAHLIDVVVRDLEEER